jgi:hypothetical protein
MGQADSIDQQGTVFEHLKQRNLRLLMHYIFKNNTFVKWGSNATPQANVMLGVSRSCVHNDPHTAGNGPQRHMCSLPSSGQAQK